jgi:hypothetical protein
MPDEVVFYFRRNITKENQTCNRPAGMSLPKFHIKANKSGKQVIFLYKKAGRMAHFLLSTQYSASLIPFCVAFSWGISEKYCIFLNSP